LRIPLLWFLIAAFGLSVQAQQPMVQDEARGTERLVRFLGLEAPIPATWQEEPPSSSMRLAQYRLAGAADDSNAEVIFYYFGQGQGGTPEANIARWQSQFFGPDETPVQPDVQSFEVAGMTVTRAKLQGTYARGAGIGPQGEGKSDQTLIAAIVDTHRGQVIIQLHGDTDLVERSAPGFDAMLKGLKAATTP
jgi:hypothetical protein